MRRIRTIFSVVMFLLMMGGGCGSGSTNSPLPPATSPTFWPVSGSCSPTQQVTISDATPGAYAEFKNVAFGTGLTGVSARVACDSSNGALCGGSLEFRLDSTNGALIATVAIPGTGGWQNWTTASASVNGASGNHDLYVVFSGSNNLGNLNWFQFK